MRTRLTISGLVFAMGFLYSFQCKAGSPHVDIQTLLASCRALETSAQWGYCVGYIEGIADKMWVTGLQRTEYGDGTKPTPNESICPDANNYDASVTVPLFVNWAEHHPEKSQLPAFLGVADALQEKWPCKPSN